MREWQSPKGKRQVLGQAPGRPLGWMLVHTEGERFDEYLKEDEIDAVAARDESNLARRLELQAKEDEKQKIADAQKATRHDLHGFTDGLPKFRQERIATVLAKQISYKGKITTIRQHIENMVNDDGAVIEYDHPVRWLVRPDDTFWDEKKTTKISMDYAEYLISRR